MAPTKQQIEDDIHFIFNEGARFRRMERQWFDTREYPPELTKAFLWEIAHPTDQPNKLTVGRAAIGRLEGLAATALQRAGLARQVDLFSVRGPLGTILGV